MVVKLHGSGTLVWDSVKELQPHWSVKRVELRSVNLWLHLVGKTLKHVYVEKEQ